MIETRKVTINYSKLYIWSVIARTGRIGIKLELNKYEIRQLSCEDCLVLCVVLCWQM